MQISATHNSLVFCFFVMKLIVSPFKNYRNQSGEGRNLNNCLLRKGFEAFCSSKVVTLLNKIITLSLMLCNSSQKFIPLLRLSEARKPIPVNLSTESDKNVLVVTFIDLLVLDTRQKPIQYCIVLLYIWSLKFFSHFLKIMSEIYFKLLVWERQAYSVKACIWR